MAVQFAVTFAAVSSSTLAAELWVAKDAGCADTRTAETATAPGAGWCSLGRAALLARPGDTVRVGPGTYRESVRFDVSGTAAAPIRFVAEPGAIIDAAGSGQALKLMDVSHLELSGFTATGAATQGIWIQGGAGVHLAGLDVVANAGTGITIKDAAGLAVEDSVIAANAGAGILELAGTTAARYTANEIRENGRGAATYNGDGIQLGGLGAVVADNLIVANGSSTYEHGIYTSASSGGWTIERNVFADAAGANVKAAGGPGVVRRNRLTNGRFGLVLSDNPQPVVVEHNILDGRAQHLVFVTAGSAPGNARLLANTVVQSGRSTTSGDASAVFVNAAASLEVRDNLLCYDGADSLGVALWVNDPARVRRLVSDTNWFCARDGQSRHLAWAGSRTTLSGWRASSGQDPRSISSWAPQFDAARRVTSTNWGVDRGDNLGLAEDHLGTPLPPTGPVDIGALQTT